MSPACEPPVRPNDPIARVARADRLMKGHLFIEAIDLYEAHLAVVPNDLVVLLKSGICHLLNRSEKRFIKIYFQAKEMTASVRDISAEALALWRKYEGLALKVTAGALFVGGIVVTGYPCLADSPDARPGAAPAVTDPAATPPDSNTAPTDPAVGEFVKPPPHDNWVGSAHKYSAGVYIPRKPPASTHKDGAGEE